MKENSVYRFASNLTGWPGVEKIPTLLKNRFHTKSLIQNDKEIKQKSRTKQTQFQGKTENKQNKPNPKTNNPEKIKTRQVRTVWFVVCLHSLFRLHDAA